MKPFTVEITIPDSRIADLLTTGLEGGVNYWARIEEKREPTSLTYRSSQDRIYWPVDYPMNEGGWIVIQDKEADNKAEAHPRPKGFGLRLA
jgi:hypothetical protein